MLRSALRESDATGRFGGDELVALLADAGITETQGVTQRLTQLLGCAQCRRAPPLSDPL